MPKTPSAPPAARLKPWVHYGLSEAETALASVRKLRQLARSALQSQRQAIKRLHDYQRLADEVLAAWDGWSATEPSEGQFERLTAAIQALGRYRGARS